MGLEEVQDGKLVFTDGVTAGAIYFTSPLSLPFVLEHLVPALASTIAGEGPATIDDLLSRQSPAMGSGRGGRLAVSKASHSSA